MTWFQGFSSLGITFITVLFMFGCVTGNSASEDSSSLVSQSEHEGGQATTVTAEGLVKHEEVCVPVAETDRVQTPSLELGVSRDTTTADTRLRPYTRFNCR
jgi:hypothetical protein